MVMNIDQWRAFMKTAMNLLVSQNAGNFLTHTMFSKRTALIIPAVEAT